MIIGFARWSLKPDYSIGGHQSFITHLLPHTGAFCNLRVLRIHLNYRKSGAQSGSQTPITRLEGGCFVQLN